MFAAVNIDSVHDGSVSPSFVSTGMSSGTTELSSSHTEKSREHPFNEAAETERD